jgi:hypothetical protein
MKLRLYMTLPGKLLAELPLPPVVVTAKGENRVLANARAGRSRGFQESRCHTLWRGHETVRNGKAPPAIASCGACLFGPPQLAASSLILSFNPPASSLGLSGRRLRHAGPRCGPLDLARAVIMQNAPRRAAEHRHLVLVRRRKHTPDDDQPAGFGGVRGDRDGRAQDLLIHLVEDDHVGHADRLA